MDYHMMRAAPAAPTVVESARQYYNAGKMAVELAGYIRSCGYPARAHIDANYHVVCPLVARDAGLGEIGRMGLLMTPDLGPRVRIAVVTTDMPLEPTPSKPDPSVIDFCRRCKKCAIVCPGRSIPFGMDKQIGGVKRWQIHSESCYTYWCQAGTDCGRCVIVCPFSHPDNWFHRLVRFGISNSFIFRRLAVPLDDLFYGRKPRPRDPLRSYSDLKL
jgi:reductive dehalogenase